MEENLVKDYLDNLEASGVRKAALASAQRTVHRLLEYVNEYDLTLTALSHEEAWGYQRWLLSRENYKAGASEAWGVELKKSSVRSYVTGAKRFIAYLVRKSLCPANAFDGVKAPRREASVTKGVMKVHEMEKFLTRLEEWDGSSKLSGRQVAYRWHVMAELQYATGMRIDEVFALELADIDLARGEITVRLGKGSQERRVYLTSYALEVLKLYLTLRPLLVQGREAGERVFPLSTQIRYNRALKEASLAVGGTAGRSHLLRHALGYHLLKAGASIRWIKEILGHKRISTSQVYTQVDTSDTRRVLELYHPRGKE